MTILDKLAASTKARCEAAKGKIPPEEIRRLAENTPKGDLGFEKALKKPGMSFICECKRASPSKGLIAPEFPYLDIARDYEAAGADCVSVLTEPEWFLGSDRYLEEIAHMVGIPCLRKDFTVDEYMIYEAKLLGASAVLLIAACQSIDTCASLLATAHDLGLEVLLEMHDERDLDYAALEPDMCGINNRNLGTFVTDVHNSFAMAARLPAQAVKVSESGIGSPATVRRLRAAGYDGFLVGEQLMKQSNPGQALQQFIDAL